LLFIVGRARFPVSVSCSSQDYSSKTPQHPHKHGRVGFRKSLRDADFTIPISCARGSDYLYLFEGGEGAHHRGMELRLIASVESMLSARGSYDRRRT
jgi:hypothetical protein